MGRHARVVAGRVSWAAGLAELMLGLKVERQWRWPGGDQGCRGTLLLKSKRVTRIAGWCTSHRQRVRNRRQRVVKACPGTQTIHAKKSMTPCRGRYSSNGSAREARGRRPCWRLWQLALARCSQQLGDGARSSRCRLNTVPESSGSVASMVPVVPARAGDDRHQRLRRWRRLSATACAPVSSHGRALHRHRELAMVLAPASERRCEGRILRLGIASDGQVRCEQGERLFRRRTLSATSLAWPYVDGGSG